MVGYTGAMRLKDVAKTLNYDAKKKVLDHVATLKRTESTVPDDWDGAGEAPSRSNYLIYLAIGTFFFFFITVSVAYFVRFAGIDRGVSTSKITILTQGPTTVDSGSVAPLTVRVSNGNPVAIHDVTLTINYPNGTYMETDTVTRASPDEFSLGSMETGEVAGKNIAPILYGIDGQRKQITYELRYRTEGMSQPSSVTEAHTVTLRTTPILVSEPSHTSPVSGKEVTFGTVIQSNMADVIEAVYVQVAYPSGFTPRTFSTPPFNAEGTIWKIPSIQPNEQRKLWVKGIINGQDQDEQAIVVSVSVAPTGRFSEAVKVAEESTVFAIERSFVDVGIRLNGKNDETVVVSPGGMVTAQLSWTNLDRDRIRDLVITADISGSGLDESSISPGNGYFDGPRNRIVWDKQQTRSFASVRPGGGGSLSFSFRALPDRVEFSRAQRDVVVSVSVRALRGKTNTVDTVDRAAVRQVLLRGVLRAAAHTLFSTSEQKNQGPLPPRVGRKTSYTLKYFVKNSGNPAEDFTMTVPLARDVFFTGRVDGISPDMWTYDGEFNEVNIRIPAIAATGSRASRSIELQVIVTPKERDVGRSIVLAKRTSWKAKDVHVNEVLGDSLPELTTRISAESLDLNERSGIVAP